MCLGIPGQIVRIDDIGRKLASANVGGIRRQVNIACVVDETHPIDTCVGDWVLIHAGFAMTRINAEEAAKTLEILAAIGEAQAELEAMRVSRVSMRQEAPE
jgi:hydrogenase expression/formation protein HypC